MEGSNQYSNEFMNDVLMTDDILMDFNDSNINKQTDITKVYYDNNQTPQLTNKEINESNFEKLFQFDSSNLQNQQEQNSIRPDQLLVDGSTTLPDSYLETDENFLSGFLGLQSTSELMKFNQSFNNIQEPAGLNSDSTRSSNEFFDTYSLSGSDPHFDESPNSSNSYNSNDINQILANQALQPNIQQKQKRFQFSNPLSNMFRTQSQKLRGINPLSSNKEGTQTIPSQFIENMNYTTQITQVPESVDPLCISTTIEPVPSNPSPEELGLLKRGTRSATNSIVNALNSARFSFNKQKADKLTRDAIKEQGQEEEEEEEEEEETDNNDMIDSIMNKMLNLDSFKDEENDFIINNQRLLEDPRASLDAGVPQNMKIKVENIDGVGMNFDEELNKVISMASQAPSNYDFNSMTRSSIDNNSALNPPNVTVAFIKDNKAFQQSSSSSIRTAKSSQSGTSKELDANNEPNYAALFSNMNPKKRSSRSFSIGKLSLSQAKQTEDATPLPNTATPTSPGQAFQNNFLKIEEDDEISLRTPRTSIQSIPDDLSSFDNISTQSPKFEQKVRGRKPTTDYDASRTFLCKVCTRRFKREEHLKRHFRSLHMHEKPFNCPKCNKKFSRTDNLTQHIKTHSVDELKQ